MVLSFSFIGMKTKEVNYAGQKELDVVLEEELSEMDEVVVTGYQKIERRKLTSSITTVDMETLKTVNQPNIDKLLQGQVPGMTIMSTSGAPVLCLRSESGVRRLSAGMYSLCGW